MQLSPRQENEIRIRKHYRTCTITTVEQALFLEVVDVLDVCAHSTQGVAWAIKTTTNHARKVLRRMQDMGYVTGESNGSNKTTWSLVP